MSARFSYPHKLVAHRGGGTLAPENTLAAIRVGLAHRGGSGRGGVGSLPGDVPGPEAVARGWRQQVERASRLDLPDAALVLPRLVVAAGVSWALIDVTGGTEIPSVVLPWPRLVATLVVAVVAGATGQLGQGPHRPREVTTVHQHGAVGAERGRPLELRALVQRPREDRPVRARRPPRRDRQQHHAAETGEA